MIAIHKTILRKTGGWTPTVSELIVRSIAWQSLKGRGASREKFVSFMRNRCLSSYGKHHLLRTAWSLTKRAHRIKSDRAAVAKVLEKCEDFENGGLRSHRGMKQPRVTPRTKLRDEQPPFGWKLVAGTGKQTEFFTEMRATLGTCRKARMRQRRTSAGETPCQHLCARLLQAEAVRNDSLDVVRFAEPEVRLLRGVFRDCAKPRNLCAKRQRHPPGVRNSGPSRQSFLSKRIHVSGSENEAVFASSRFFSLICT